MILGLSIPAFIALHVGISLIGIVTGLVAMAALAARRWLPGLHAVFLVTTAATSLTGFLFPFRGFTPALGVGVISTVILAVAFAALYAFGLRGRARTVYVVSAMAALYLNLFVLVVQSFLKLPALNALAPTGTEPPFAAAQAAMLVASLILGVAAYRGSRTLGVAPASS